MKDSGIEISLIFSHFSRKFFDYKGICGTDGVMRKVCPFSSPVRKVLIVLRIYLVVSFAATSSSFWPGRPDIAM